MIACVLATASGCWNGDDPPAASRLRGVQRIEIDDLDLKEALAVTGDPAGGIWVSFYDSAVRVQDGKTDRSVKTGPTAPEFAAGADGTVAYADFDDVVVIRAGSTEPRRIPIGVTLRSIAIAADGTILVGDSGGGLHAVDATGTARELPTVAPEEEPQISSIVALPDGGLVVVADGLTSKVLFVDGEQTRTLSTAEPGEHIGRVWPAPDGSIVVADRFPVVEIVDPDSGTAREVASLGTVEVTSMTTVGADLVILSEGRLWRLPGVLD